jgi:hypothetical protein
VLWGAEAAAVIGAAMAIGFQNSRLREEEKAR